MTYAAPIPLLSNTVVSPYHAPPRLPPWHISLELLLNLQLALQGVW